MDRIQLTPEQIEVYTAAEDLIEVCDPDGKVVGRILSAQLQETVADIKRRRQTPGPMYSSAQVREMLQRLEEVWETEGPFGAERGREIVAELRKSRAVS
jgi:hypothetical protein